MRNTRNKLRQTRAKFKTNKMSKKELKEKEKNNFINYIDFINKVSNLSFPSSNIRVKKLGMESFFKEVDLPTNKIHVLQGLNGSGKTNFLKNVANAFFLDCLEHIDNRIKISSNNAKVAKALNMNTYLNPYNENGFYFDKVLASNSVSKDEVFIVLYVDFTTTFFNTYETPNRLDLDKIIGNVNDSSNGEQKLKIMKDVIDYLDLVTKEEIIKPIKGLNFLVILDEPDQGLSLVAQRELKNRLNGFIKQKLKTTTISFLIASHSLIWDSCENAIIHDIEEFKLDNNKKINKVWFPKKRIKFNPISKDNK